jgi:hypothetical protein
VPADGRGDLADCDPASSGAADHHNDGRGPGASHWHGTVRTRPARRAANTSATASDRAFALLYSASHGHRPVAIGRRGLWAAPAPGSHGFLYVYSLMYILIMIDSDESDSDSVRLLQVGDPSTPSHWQRQPGKLLRVLSSLTSRLSLSP